MRAACLPSCCCLATGGRSPCAAASIASTATTRPTASICASSTTNPPGRAWRRRATWWGLAAATASVSGRVHRRHCPAPSPPAPSTSMWPTRWWKAPATPRTSWKAKLREVFRLRGIALSDVEILSAMDKGGDTPWVLPPMYLKSGELKKTARALTMPQLTALLTHAREVAVALADRLFGGRRPSAPRATRTAALVTGAIFARCAALTPRRPDAPFRDLPEMGMERAAGGAFPAPEEKQ